MDSGRSRAVDRRRESPLGSEPRLGTTPDAPGETEILAPRARFYGTIGTSPFVYPLLWNARWILTKAS